MSKNLRGGTVFNVAAPDFCFRRRQRCTWLQQSEVCSVGVSFPLVRFVSPTSQHVLSQILPEINILHTQRKV